jgi:hypothetical protein
LKKRARALPLQEEKSQSTNGQEASGTELKLLELERSLVPKTAVTSLHKIKEESFWKSARSLLFRSL